MINLCLENICSMRIGTIIIFSRVETRKLEFSVLLCNALIIYVFETYQIMKL